MARMEGGDTKDGNFKCVDGLNEVRDRGVKGLMINYGGCLKEIFNRATIEKIKGDPVHSFASEGALKGASASIEVSTKLWKESLSMGKRVNLEVYPPSAIWTFSNLPVSLEVVTRCKDDPDLLKEVWPRFLSNAWINGYEDIVNRVSLIAGHDRNRDEVL